MKGLLTVKQAAPLMKLSEQGLYSAIREHQLPDGVVVRIGRQLRLDLTALRGRSVEDREVAKNRSEAHDAK